MNLSKRILCVILIVFCVGLSGCATQNGEEKVYDQAFLKDFSKGLIDRWDVNSSNTNDYEDQRLAKAIDAELKRVDQYKNKKFEDSNLQEKAISYINLLYKQKEALEYYDVDYTKFNEAWKVAYDARTQLIKELTDTYNLEFPKKYQENVSEIMTNAKIVRESEFLENNIKTMTDSIVFKKVKSSYGFSYYEAIVENITDKTFENFSITISLLDDEGVIIEEQYSMVSNFAPGKKAKLEFMTDVEFEKCEISSDYYIKE